MKEGKLVPLQTQEAASQIPANAVLFAVHPLELSLMAKTLQSRWPVWRSLTVGPGLASRKTAVFIECVLPKVSAISLFCPLFLH